MFYCIPPSHSCVLSYFYQLTHNEPPNSYTAAELSKGGVMNWDQIEGTWKQSTGVVKEKWGKLTDDDLTVIAGKKDQLVGKIQERYGLAKDAAEKQVDEFTRSYKSSNAALDRETRDRDAEIDAANRSRARSAGKS